MKRFLLVAQLVAALAACASPTPQAATVTIGDRDCDVQPADLAEGNVGFTVNNTTDQPVLFKVTENGGADVGGVNVGAGVTGRLQVHLDGDDTYHLACGAVSGPDIKPS